VVPLFEHAAPHHTAQLALALACVLAAGAAAGRALAAGPVGGEHIFAALSAYMLVGIGFGVVYWLLEVALPGCFTLGPAGAFTPQRAIYFSFVTQATLGYGDVVPLREESQGLVIVQAVGGQMYLAVLVARLVSLYSAQKR
jgi:voltage-gated potassium channel Kch